MRSVKAVLTEELMSQVEELHKIQVGDEKYKNAVDGVAKLSAAISTIEKNEQDAIAKENARIDECELKAQQLADEKKDRMIKHAIDIGSTVGYLGVLCWGVVASINFEKTGHIWSTEAGRSFARKILNLKK